ncbi:MAG: hypothetical protein OXC68_06585 [Aestuariivita sp.]|nr:hypothetical protein [Aestuariivita sp.]
MSWPGSCGGRAVLTGRSAYPDLGVLEERRRGGFLQAVPVTVEERGL